MRILMIAADRMEFPGILASTRNARTAAVPVDWARQAQLGGNEFLLVANGIGRKRAVAAVDTALANFRADAIVSTGFCGALSPELSVGDIVSATSVTNGVERFPVLQPDCSRP